MTSLNIKLKNGNEAQASTQLTHGMAQTINWLAAYINTDRKQSWIKSKTSLHLITKIIEDVESYYTIEKVEVLISTKKVSNRNIHNDEMRSVQDIDMKDDEE